MSSSDREHSVRTGSFRGTWRDGFACAARSFLFGGKKTGLSSESGLDLLLEGMRNPEDGATAVPLRVSRGVSSGALERCARAASSPFFGGKASGLASESGLDMLLVGMRNPACGRAVPLRVSRGVPSGAFRDRCFKWCSGGASASPVTSRSA